METLSRETTVPYYKSTGISVPRNTSMVFFYPVETFVSGDYGPLPEIHRGFSSPQHIRRIIILPWHCCRQKEFAVEILLELNVAMEMHGNQTLLWTAYRQRCRPMETPLHFPRPVDVLRGIEIPMESAREHKFPWIAVGNGAVAIRMLRHWHSAPPRPRVHERCEQQCHRQHHQGQPCGLR